MIRGWRIASVFVPPIAAGALAFRAGGEQRADLIGALVLAWWVMSAVLVIRYCELTHGRRDDDARPDAIGQLDVLTGTGRALMWSGLAAIVLATKTEWASLAVVGVLGLAAACLAVTWTALVAGGDRPWRRARITRAILPAQATEGDPLREELVLAEVRIPAGLRLFAQGRATPHGVVTRYSLGSDASRAEVKLESELGAAPRGEHAAPPLALWLGDVLGIARTPVVHRGAATFSAVPKPIRIDDARPLLGAGGDAAQTTPTQRMPTEGTFRIREYIPGDDARRIHWIRSLQANQLVVRLPDEIPQAEPAVRLVLDNWLAGTETLTCTAHAELLDSLVRIWLGVGNALAEHGTRVTLVAAVETADGRYAPVERALVTRSSRQALQLGARVAWQPAVSLAALLSNGRRRSFEPAPPRTIVVTSRPKPRDLAQDIGWVVVPELAWTTHGWQPLPQPLWMTLPFPAGSAENRWGRRRAQRRRILKQWDDRSSLTLMLGSIDWQQYSGELVARPRDGRVALEVVP